jgi:two-component system phosphate regulon sensor histidine kinase PhoR
MDPPKMDSLISRLLDFLPDPIAIVDVERRIVDSNRLARDLLGAEIDGRDLALSFRHPEALAAVDAVLGGEDCERLVEIVIPVPVVRYFEVRVSALADGISDTGRAIIVLNDVTVAKGAEQMRADFVANVSHELRSPLAALFGFIQTLQGHARDDPEARDRFLGIMESEAARMKRLIDDLLSLSKVESNEHIAPEQRADIAKITRGVHETLTMRAAERGIEIQIDCPGDQVEVIGDAGELTVVIHNLVDNAVSYGEPDSVVGAKIETAERIPVTGAPGISIAVTNACEGIAPEHVARLTERFYRIDKARSRSTGGTGLGLAIVKHVVNRHRGHLAIDSRPGTGVTFAGFSQRVSAVSGGTREFCVDVIKP